LESAENLKIKGLAVPDIEATRDMQTNSYHQLLEKSTSSNTAISRKRKSLVKEDSVRKRSNHQGLMTNLVDKLCPDVACEDTTSLVSILNGNDVNFQDDCPNLQCSPTRNIPTTSRYVFLFILTDL